MGSLQIQFGSYVHESDGDTDTFKMPIPTQPDTNYIPQVTMMSVSEGPGSVVPFVVAGLDVDGIDIQFNHSPEDGDKVTFFWTIYRS